MDSVDIIIVNYHSGEYLKKCLLSIEAERDNRVIHVYVQNNSANENIVYPQNPHLKLLITSNERNIGFAAAVNRAVAMSNSPYFLLLNPDSIIHKRFFSSAINYLERNETIGILGPRIFETDGTVQGSARFFPNPLTALFGRTSLLSKLFPGNRWTCKNMVAHASDINTPVKVDWVSGAAMVVRRRALTDVGLLDERFFMYWEDADWCRRMWEKGWQVVYFPQAEVTHHAGKSSAGAPLRSTLEFHKSAYRLFVKYATGLERLLVPFAFCALGIRCQITLIRICIHKLFQNDSGKDRVAINKRISK